jgi:ABC-type uncharacterized transport system substrate-binding protein
MKKLFFLLVVCLMLSSTACAAKNVFCTNFLTNNDCIEKSHEVYQSIIDAYVGRTLRYKQKKGQPADKDEIKARAEQVMPYDTFYEFFQECGKNRQNPSSAKTCRTSKFQKLLLKNME